MKLIENKNDVVQALTNLVNRNLQSGSGFTDKAKGKVGSILPKDKKGNYVKVDSNELALDSNIKAELQKNPPNFQVAERMCRSKEQKDLLVDLYMDYTLGHRDIDGKWYEERKDIIRHIFNDLGYSKSENPFVGFFNLLKTDGNIAKNMQNISRDFLIAVNDAYANNYISSKDIDGSDTDNGIYTKDPNNNSKFLLFDKNLTYSELMEILSEVDTTYKNSKNSANEVYNNMKKLLGSNYLTREQIDYLLKMVTAYKNNGYSPVSGEKKGSEGEKKK